MNLTDTQLVAIWRSLSNIETNEFPVGNVAHPRQLICDALGMSQHARIRAIADARASLVQAARYEDAMGKAVCAERIRMVERFIATSWME